MIPPHQPFVQVLEVVLNTLFYPACAWAWCCIASAISNAIRDPTSPEAIAKALEGQTDLTGQDRQLALAASGVFLQAGPAIVCSVFLSVGCGILLWWKVRTGPGPAVFAVVLSCILIDVVSMRRVVHC
jgi:hypothetical protein